MGRKKKINVEENIKTNEQTANEQIESPKNLESEKVKSENAETSESVEMTETPEEVISKETDSEVGSAETEVPEKTESENAELESTESIESTDSSESENIEENETTESEQAETTEIISGNPEIKNAENVESENFELKNPEPEKKASKKSSKKKSKKEKKEPAVESENSPETEKQVETENFPEQENLVETENQIEQKDEGSQTSVQAKSTKKKKHVRISFQEAFEKMQSNLPLMIFTCIFSFILMALVALVVFFATVEGPEKVMVPNVVGKKLEEGLLEMQVKELYPKINLRYSDTPGDEGQILDQSPVAGSIVKGYSRVSLVVSRGVVVDSVDNYIGQNLDELKMKLQTLFAGMVRPLIVIGDVSYKPDATDAGTILEQDPPEGTSITDPVTVNLVVSRGPNYDNTKPPYLIGKSVNDVLQTITRSKLIFDFTYHIAYDDEVPGTVTEQQKFDTEFVPNYTHMAVEMALPAESDDGNVYGIFDTEIDALPYAVPMRLEAVPAEGDAYTIISFTHNGGNLTLPYAVPADTRLLLYVDNKVRAEEIVH